MPLRVVSAHCIPRGVADALPGRTEPLSNPQRRVHIRGLKPHESKVTPTTDPRALGNRGLEHSDQRGSTGEVWDIWLPTG